MPTAASTLSLGDSAFTLASSTGPGTPTEQISVTGSYPSISVKSTTGSSIENLSIGVSGSDTVNNSVFFQSGVSGLDANLGGGADTLIFTSTSSVESSTISLGTTSAADVFRADGGFNYSTVDTGGGNDTLSFSKSVLDSSVTTGGGNDSITFQANSLVYNTSVSTGTGNDSVTFLGSVFGGENSQISLGSGADTLVFGANSYVEGYAIDLGSDTSVDSVFFNAGLDDSQAIQITGANTGDTLFIGSGDFAGSYTYDGTDFTDGSDSLTWLT